jgi:tellurite methyltransferase
MLNKVAGIKLMKNQKVADYYNKLYADDEKAFSGEPLPLAKLLAERLPSGKILEIAAGAGRNALFLATKGYEVRATDISSSAIEKLAQQARDKGIRLETAVSDVTEEEFKGDYDAIICTYTFHHLTETDAELVIKKMQQHTKPQGFNLITTFTKNGDFFKNHPDTPNFYPDNKEQLELLYEGWKLIRSFEKEGKARALDTEGKPQSNIFAGLLAQKI